MSSVNSATVTTQEVTVTNADAHSAGAIANDDATNPSNGSTHVSTKLGVNLATYPTDTQVEVDWTGEKRWVTGKVIDTR